MDNKLKLCGDYTTWSNVSFEDIVDRVSTQKKSGNLPYVEFEDIISGEGILNKNIYERHNVKNGIYFVKGDVLFGKLRPYLKNILLANFNGIAVGDFWVLRSHGVLPYILYLVVNSNKFMRIANISSGSKMPRSDWAIVSKAMIAIPKSIEEQQKIASYFQSLDSLIQTTSKKLASLKQIKVASLQSMLPQEGETVPKVRFKGFDGEWERCSLGSLSMITKGEQINKLDLYTINKYYVLNGGITPSGYTNRYNTEANTISISEGGNSCGYVNFNKEKFWSGGHNYTLQKVKINNYYLYSFLKKNEASIMSKRVGSGLPNIQKKSLTDFLITYPSQKDEQQKIASYFCNLDKQISLQTQRLEKLKQIKATCLDKMFV